MCFPIKYLLSQSVISLKDFFPAKLAGPIVLGSSFLIHSVQAALSITTINSIKGTSPIFIDEISLNDFKYFGVNYNNKSYYDDTLLNNAFSSLALSAKTSKPSDISGLSVAPFGMPTADEVVDSDGDNVNPISITETQNGSVSVAWYDKATNTALTSTQLNQTFCQLSYLGISPYIKVFGSVNLNTQYGDPHKQVYPDNILSLPTPERAFPINIDPQLCSAMPDRNSMTVGVAGPASEWDPIIGFLPQSDGNNFPTTGLNSLYFDLVIAGVAADDLTWPSSMTSGNITVNLTVSPTMVRVKLSGPTANTNLQGAKADAFVGPASFVIEGKDQQGNVIIQYSFTIKKWFVNRSSPYYITSQRTWCNALSGSNYSLATVRDLTNSSVGPAAPSGFPLPLSSRNVYMRKIGAGLSTEWGNLGNYPDATMSYIGYWTNDANTSGGFYGVGVNDGDVRNVEAIGGTTYYALCASK
ncbi:hypothetical protein DES39_0428 [Orbus hercynius]|uniref:Uncharacterized protein n=2 Tax=Orbus hercynius TaxID=593135 RepID=A0A495RIP2_9GAMM|nr:hypothetical protein DES39_0428 [Orbus hercynius]